MKYIFVLVISQLLRLALGLRYRIKVIGLEKIQQEVKFKDKGILFLANHPAEVDPAIVARILWLTFHPKPVALDALFRKPMLGTVLEMIGAIHVPDFEDASNSYKRKQITKSYQKILTELDQHQNILLYPAGGLKHQNEEIIGGNSGVYQLISRCPDINIVLVRTQGLWGSLFSRALTGKSPDLGASAKEAFWVLVKNILFFAPRRAVEVEFATVPKDFPYAGNKLEINHFLENWYNNKGPEPLQLVPYHFINRSLPKVVQQESQNLYDISTVSDEMQQTIKNEISRLSRMPIQDISLDKDLSKDLGLDSLDLSQLVLFLKENYNITHLHSSDLTTVASAMASPHNLKEMTIDEELSINKTEFQAETSRPPVKPPDGDTIIEAFLANCDRMGKAIACEDLATGKMSYKRIKLASIALAEKIKVLPGDRIGIMLPASVGVNVVILASMLAGKIPVMINWTLGTRTIESIIAQTGIQCTLTSWKFLDRLENIELDGIDEQVLLLEDLKKQVTVFDKLKALQLANSSIKNIVKHFGLKNISKDDPAVLLFTSGTESDPKGVPLSHCNILSNQRAALQHVQFNQDDIMLGALPPFHSFGFSVTGLLPLLTGLRLALTPNPTDGRALAQAIERWKISVVCLAPTFLKNILRAAKVTQLQSLRLVVTGAEKTPHELIEKMAEMNPQTEMIEGYGITECAPIISQNIPDAVNKGVGKPLENVELIIVHPETFTLLPIGEIGLILLRGPNVFKGYLNYNISSPFVEVADKTWYNTGDLGYLDDEGYLFLAGRIKRFVKIGAEMISLTAIEEALLRYALKKQLPLQENAPNFAAVAIETNRKTEIDLFVTFAMNATEVNKILKEEGMSNLVKVTSVHHIDHLPLLATGKIDYRSLKDRLK